jgi:hypothetical protein
MVANIVSASSDDVFYGVRQIVIKSKDDIPLVIDIATQAGRYGWRESIIFEMVAKYSGTNLFAESELRIGAMRGGWAAIHRIGCQPEARKHGANVGAELPLRSVFRNISLIASGISESISGVNRSFSIDSSILHFGQLAAQRIPLQERRPQGTETNEDKGGGPNHKPSSNIYQRGLVGALVICAGAALLGFAMKLGYKTFETPWLILPAIGLGIIAAAVTIHGLWYACLGTWRLPGLYIL